MVQRLQATQDHLLASGWIDVVRQDGVGDFYDAPGQIGRDIGLDEGVADGSSASAASEQEPALTEKAMNHESVFAMLSFTASPPSPLSA